MEKEGDPRSMPGSSFTASVLDFKRNEAVRRNNCEKRNKSRGN